MEMTKKSNLRQRKKTKTLGRANLSRAAGLDNWAEIKILRGMEPIKRTSQRFVNQFVDLRDSPLKRRVIRDAFECGMAHAFHVVWLCMGDVGAANVYDFFEEVEDGLLRNQPPKTRKGKDRMENAEKKLEDILQRIESVKGAAGQAGKQNKGQDPMYA